jgi:hypothetical protein
VPRLWPSPSSSAQSALTRSRSARMEAPPAAAAQGAEGP